MSCCFFSVLPWTTDLNSASSSPSKKRFGVGFAAAFFVGLEEETLTELLPRAWRGSLGGCMAVSVMGMLSMLIVGTGVSSQYAVENGLIGSCAVSVEH